MSGSTSPVPQAEPPNPSVGAVQAQGAPMDLNTVIGSEHSDLLECFNLSLNAHTLDNAIFQFSDTVNKLDNDDGFLMVKKTNTGSGGNVIHWSFGPFELVITINGDGISIEFFVKIPFDGKHKVASVKGLLKVGVELKISTAIVKGSIRVDLRNLNEVWMKISLKSLLGDVEKDIHLFDIL